MELGKYSYMAEATALFRAAHQLFDDDPKILDDPLAFTLLGPDTEQTLYAELERHSSWHAKRARTLAVVRSRYTEDQLAAAIDRGVTQYVILGAGLDTSPYRPGHPGETARTYEVDHPDTQAWKLERLAEAGIEIRANLMHIAVDFERQSLLDGLTAHGFDMTQPAFFSWLGVIYYLHPEASIETCRQVASCVPGSQLVLDFVVSDAVLTRSEREAVEKITAFVKTRGEPWLSRFSPDELETLLRDVGFGEVDYFSRERATATYLKDRTDGLSLDPAIQLMSAVV